MDKVVWITSTERQQWQTSTDYRVKNLAASDANSAVRNAGDKLIVTEEEGQQLLGFGGCFNELGYIALQKLPQSEREQILDSLFLPTSDQRFDICRLPIGASDYALDWYSLNEHDGDYAMQHFSIERDKKYLIPYIKEALKRNPQLKLFASPWSPPTWMKFPKAYNFGTLRFEPKVLKAYALYFVKFVQAYAAEGITIHQIHVQNEVVADQKFPSCVWTGDQLRIFIGQYLGPAFKQHGIESEIWLGTINAPEAWDEWIKRKETDFNGYANTVLSDPEAYQYISGVGYQWAGKYAIQRTAMSYSELQYLQTENECGDGENTWFYARYVFNLYHHYFINGVNGYIYWNMVLEPEGMSTWGWKQNSMITINPASQTVIYNPEYYVMKHFAHYIGAGAVRLALRGPWCGNALAFRNAQGQRIIVVANPFKNERKLSIDLGNGKLLQRQLEPESFHTIVIE